MPLPLKELKMVWSLLPDGIVTMLFRIFPLRRAMSVSVRSLPTKMALSRMAGEGVVRYLTRHVSIVLVGAPDSFVVV